MKLYLKYFFLAVLLLTQFSFAQTKEPKPRKKHRNLDTVGIVNGVVITFYDFRQELINTIREHKKEVKDSVISDTAYTRFVNIVWDKLVTNLIVEKELEKRKLTLTSDKTIDMLLKNPPKELKIVFTDSSSGKFDEKAMKAYLKNPNPDLQRTKILDYYQTTFEHARLAAALVPKARNGQERMEEFGQWLKKKIDKANIEDRRTGFGFY